jgi:hypothetical protein
MLADGSDEEAGPPQPALPLWDFKLAERGGFSAGGARVGAGSLQWAAAPALHDAGSSLQSTMTSLPPHSPGFGEPAAGGSELYGVYGQEGSSFSMGGPVDRDSLSPLGSSTQGSSTSPPPLLNRSAFLSSQQVIPLYNHDKTMR